MSTATTDPSNNSHAEFLLNAFSHVEDGKINWTRVAADNSIGYARNATAKFNNIAKQYGYKYEGQKVIKLEDGGVASSTPTTPKTPRKKKTSSGVGSTTPASSHSNKKRKVVESVEDDMSGIASSGDDEA